MADPLEEHSGASSEKVPSGGSVYMSHVDVSPEGRFRHWVLLAPVPGVLEVPTLDGPELSDDEVRGVDRALSRASDEVAAALRARFTAGPIAAPFPRRLP